MEKNLEYSSIHELIEWIIIFRSINSIEEWENYVKPLLLQREEDFIVFKTKFKIDLNKKDFMFEKDQVKPDYSSYKQWNKLINKIASI